MALSQRRVVQGAGARQGEAMLRMELRRKSLLLVAAIAMSTLFAALPLEGAAATETPTAIATETPSPIPTYTPTPTSTLTLGGHPTSTPGPGITFTVNSTADEPDQSP